ncbi:MAG TPA: zf-HC2 domain-containing protein [Ktedonobacterales bacterium]
MHLDPNHSRADWHANHEAQRERLSAWLDGALPAEERAALEAHLATCAACQRELDGLRQVRALLRALPDPTPPRPFLLPLDGELAMPAPPTSHIARPAGMRVAPRRWPRRAQRLGGLAAALGLALLGTSALLGGHHGADSAATTAMSSSYAPAVGAGASTVTADARVPADSGQQHAPAGAPAPTPASRTVDGAPTVSEAAPPFVPLAGGGLLAGGLILLVGGSLADRRAPGHTTD